MNMTNNIMWVDGMPFISGNALPFNAIPGFFSSNQLENIDANSVMYAFQEVFPGDYKLGWKDCGDKWPMNGVSIKFNNSEDEMWHRLKYV